MKKQDLYIVGIGASAGGLGAIQHLFDNVLIEKGMSFVIVQHLSPNFKSLMPELLAKHTSMKIFTAENEQIIKPNCIYLNQKNSNLYIKGNKLYLAEKSPRPNLNLPIDIFFHTLGEEYKENSIGIILSGTGSDGSRGIKTIKECGGTVIVQDPQSAQFDGMPNSAIATNLVDYILTPEKIAETLLRLPFNKISLLDVNDYDSETKSNEIIFYKILDLIHKQTNIDFKLYKKNTLLRRLEKRIVLNNFDKLHDYYVFLKSNNKEIDFLRHDFLIGVTNFFRDYEAFQELKTKVIPEICKKTRDDQEPIRIWVPGCSTGEEVYSIAILLDDYIKSKRLNLDYKIFATDIDERAIEAAGRGLYSYASINELGQEYTETYFVKESGSIRVIKRLRERIVFSQHNLLKNPPFIRMDLIACRNLLIYLESSTQKKVLMNFQFALNKNGFLFLGNSETLGHQSRYFNVISTKWKIFSCNIESKRAPMIHQIGEERVERVQTYNFNNPSAIQKPKYDFQFKEKPESIYYKYIGQKFSASAVFIDSSFNILFINGDITSRLSVGSGVFSNNLLKIVNKDIAAIIRSGIKKADTARKDVIHKNVLNQIGDEKFYFDLGFHKIKDEIALDKTYIIFFSEDKAFDETKSVTIKSRESTSINKSRLIELETELKENQIQLQNVVEELETSNEELQSSNEELMASNEELQSTNEELQSVNEELYTVNAELQEKNKELSFLNNDINNLLNSTDIGTLFLDNDLRIRKFTPSMQKHFNLEFEDLGRPITSFASNFSQDDRKQFIKGVKKALDFLQVIEEEVCDEQNNYYLRRISPFVTNDKKIDGVVIAFIDITALKTAQIQLKRSERLFKSVFESAGIGIATVSEKGVTLTANPELQRILEYSEIELTKMNSNEYTYPEDIEIYKLEFNKLLKGEINSFRMDKRYITKSGQVVWGDLSVTSVRNERNKFVYAVKLVKDITKQKSMESKIEFDKQFKEQILKTSPNGVYIFDCIQRNIIYSNNPFAEILGYTKEEINELDTEELKRFFHPDDYAALLNHHKKIHSGKDSSIIEFRFKHKNGKWKWIYSVDSPFEFDSLGNVTSFIGSIIDLTKKKEIELELKNAKKRAEVANIYKNQFLANMSHEIRTPMNGVVGFADLLDDDNLSKENRKKYINIIKSSSQQLLALINDIVDISKIEAGEMQLNYCPCNVNDILQNLEHTFNQAKLLKDKAHIVIKAIIPPKNKDLFIKTDPVRLRQILSNLLQNALKYSEKGTIEFGYSIPNDAFIHFYVKDEGIGIAKNKQKLIFNRFEQINRNKNLQNDGTGLGLSITKGIVDLMQGNIFVDSKPNVGTTFKIVLPLEFEDKPVQKRKRVIKPNKNSTTTILVVDDHETNLEYLAAIFYEDNFKILSALNGKEAIEIYKNHKEIDLVLMDINMPIMDGVQAAKKILEFDPKAKIIAQTAYAMSDDKQKYMALGFVDYISKPINISDLLTKVSRFTKNKK